MTQRKTATKLYKTALVVAWLWALALSAAGIYFAILSRPKEAGVDELYLVNMSGRVEVVSKNDDIARDAVLAASYGYSQANPQQIQEYLHPQADYGLGLLLMGAGLLAPGSLVAGNRWWRWLRKSDEGNANRTSNVNAEAAGIAQMAAPGPRLGETTPAPSPLDGTLSELKRLFESGLITHDEYIKKKADVLSRL
jgi:hypothetical protein